MLSDRAIVREDEQVIVHEGEQVRVREIARVTSHTHQRPRQPAPNPNFLAAGGAGCSQRKVSIVMNDKN